ncbi:MAG: pyridoxamine 5'-phosphate oxidase family protein [Treponema sp.]|jgi:nitroimidazol reductase NimA-like FMN-containing flavoprotein (pyridoxamine 5'-phosphate oxidase superfamily)|nr:pyridoxamine 5'-phosphate oxidase family protein [Treponema sp.]
MRRNDREIINIDEKINIVHQCKVCRLGLTDDDQPYIIPLNYGYTYENNILTVYFHGASEGKKVDIIRKNNKACFEIDSYHVLIEGENACNHGYGYKSIIGFGKIFIIESREEKIAGLNQIMKHQTGKDGKYEYNDIERVNVYKIIIEECTGKQR